LPTTATHKERFIHFFSQSNVRYKANVLIRQTLAGLLEIKGSFHIRWTKR